MPRSDSAVSDARALSSPHSMCSIPRPLARVQPICRLLLPPYRHQSLGSAPDPYPLRFDLSSLSYFVLVGLSPLLPLLLLLLQVLLQTESRTGVQGGMGGLSWGRWWSRSSFEVLGGTTLTTTGLPSCCCVMPNVAIGMLLGFRF